MSLLHAERLWLLLAVAGVGAALVVLHRRRAAAIARYTNPELLAAIAPERLDRRRHLPPILGVAALAALVVAIAQPARAETVPREEGVVVLAMDVSASMTAEDVDPSRMDAAIAGAIDFVDGVPAGIQVGLVAFDGVARLVVAPTSDHKSVIDAVGDLTVGPGTAAGDGLELALGAATSVLSPAVIESGEPPASVVLLSDGATTVGTPVEAAAEEAASAGVPVSTIAFGTPTGTVAVDGELVQVPADTAAMRAVAETTGGTYHEATTASELEDVYEDIRTAVGSTTEEREVTYVAVGVGFVLAALAAVAVGWAR